MFGSFNKIGLTQLFSSKNFLSLTMILGAFVISTLSVNAQVFTNSTAITVTSGPANNAVPYPSSITVSGVSGTIPATPGSIKVTFNNFSHTFPDDLGIVLVGPTGAAFLLQDGAGDDPDMVNVTYTLSDDGASFLPDLTAWTAGTYKPTAHYLAGGTSFPAPGPGLTHMDPGPAAGSATFASVFGGTNPNGTWNLYVRDFLSGDGGTFAGGWSLEINTGATVNKQHFVDFDGNGKTDFAVVRNTGGGASGQATWFVSFNGPGTAVGIQWGIASDFFVPADFDGDSKTDYAVWRPVSTGAPSGNAFWYILQSATNTVRIDDFGQLGDDPTVVGDYDGDGKADPAVYREGLATGDQSTWIYRGSMTMNDSMVQWGLNGDFPAPGDYDGDGKHDFVIQRDNGGGNAAFWRNRTMAGIDVIVYGTPTDLIVPGDYDGDGKTDIAVVRSNGSNIIWYIRRSTDGGTSFITWGLAPNDLPVQGDYDGDGKTDAAIWRPSATPGASAFYALGSTSGPLIVTWGQDGDFPVANYNTF